MTPYEHRWGWAKSLTVAEMDKFIKKYDITPITTIGITYRGIMQTHTVGDVLEAVRFCREEYRKDRRMGNREEN